MFVIFSVMYNNEQYAEKHITSVREQTIKEYKHIIVDAASEDTTPDLILQLMNRRNTVAIFLCENTKWCENAVNYLRVEDDDIVILLDGDDWFAHEKALQRVAEAYADGAWLTYGSFKPTDVSWLGHRCVPFPDSVLEDRSFRSARWVTSHLKTFKGFLWNNLNKDDLRGPDGNYAPCAYDRAIMLPMLEMCEPDRIRFIEDVIYVYNISNQICNEKINRAKQVAMAEWFHSKKRNQYPILKFHDEEIEEGDIY